MVLSVTVVETAGQVFRAGEVVAVLLPLPLAGAYDYRVPEGEQVVAGDVVRVPLGKRQENGVIWGPGRGDVAAGRIKALLGRIAGAPRLPEVSRRLVDWVASYTLSAPGAVLRMVIPVAEALEAPALAHGWLPAMGLEEAAGLLRLTPARQRVLEVASAGVPLSTADLAQAAGVGSSVIKGLAEAGVLQSVSLAARDDERQADGDHPGPQLSDLQQDAARVLVESLGAGFSTTLLQGVTGSGKTEVYFEAIAAALRQGLQVVVLVPEITLTTQWLHRFAGRFGAPPSQWHSELTPARRRRTWRAVAEGRAKVVVGARSALFLPYANLGLIIVDEEHEGAFKQEEGVIYHARDMAVVRGQLGGIPTILASATPSLETVLNVEAGRYRKVDLPSRHGGAVLPEMSILDLRKTPPEAGDWGPGWLAPGLVQAIRDTLAAGQQAMLFLNRRGYAPLTLCRACGHRLQCPNCTAWLVEHRAQGRLVCHHCGHQAPSPRACPSCGEEGQLAACGPGVERVAEEARARFPEARVALVASDTLGGPAAVAELLRQVTAHEIDLLIGTQVLAKGLHFPLLTLVGVVDADLGLSGGDLRAAERTFQLLSQVAGRAGRGEQPGRVLLQSYQPDHPVLQAMISSDAALFLHTEAEARRQLGMPPFGRMVAVVVSGPEPAAVESVANRLAATAPRASGVEIWGPAAAPLAVLRGRHRWRLLLKAPRTVKVQTLMRQWLSQQQCPSSVRIQVDVDPYSFL
ncbi:primosomal protein N' [Insolitispirillum peregrinum]|uniref:primosomal protein N' n=1 Tax=Insolitispirillum peregrinum TaxID=80876 RepID=UPI00360A2B85